MHDVTAYAADFMAFCNDCSPKMAKAYDTSTKRLARLIKKYRAEGMTDLQIGVMIGYTAQHQPGVVAALAMLAEIEDVG